MWVIWQHTSTTGNCKRKTKIMSQVFLIEYSVGHHPLPSGKISQTTNKKCNIFVHHNFKRQLFTNLYLELCKDKICRLSDCDWPGSRRKFRLIMFCCFLYFSWGAGFSLASGCLLENFNYYLLVTAPEVGNLVQKCTYSCFFS